MASQDESKPGLRDAPPASGGGPVEPDNKPGSLGEAGIEPGTEHGGQVFGSFEHGEAVGTAFADLEGRHDQFRPATVEEDAMDGPEIGRLFRDGEERRGWARPVVDGWRGALRLATGRTPPRGQRIL